MTRFVSKRLTLDAENHLRRRTNVRGLKAGFVLAERRLLMRELELSPDWFWSPGSGGSGGI